MRRFRFLLGVGLAVGLSGCAGTISVSSRSRAFRRSRAGFGADGGLGQEALLPQELCFLPKTRAGFRATAVSAKKPCFLRKLWQCKKCGQVTEPAPPPPVWGCRKRRPGSRRMRVRPCRVVRGAGGLRGGPAPIRRRIGWRVISPAFNPRGGPGVVEANWPDPLGVPPRLAVGGEEVWRTSGEGPAPGLQETSALLSPSEAGAVEQPGPAPAEGGLDAEAVPTPLPDATEGTIPAPPSPPNPSPVPPLEPSRPRSTSLRLEYEDAPAPAGRPSLTAPRSRRPAPGRSADRRPVRPRLPRVLLPGPDPDARPRPRRRRRDRGRPGWPARPGPSRSSAGDAPKRVSILARIVRRIRGAGSPCDPEPGSARGEPRDIAEQGQVLQGIPADGLDEPSER